MGRVPGVISYTVDVKTDTALVTYDAGKVNVQQIAQATSAEGYKAQVVEETK